MFNQYFSDLTDISRYLTDTENQFYKVSVILVKYWLSISLYWLININQCLTNICKI